MSDPMPVILEILRPPHWKVQEFIKNADVPDLILARTVRCIAPVTDDDELTAECGWEGIADVAVWLETGEAIFWCPDDHENEWKDT